MYYNYCFNQLTRFTGDKRLLFDNICYLSLVRRGVSQGAHCTDCSLMLRYFTIEIIGNYIGTLILMTKHKNRLTMNNFTKSIRSWKFHQSRTKIIFMNTNHEYIRKLFILFMLLTTDSKRNFILPFSTRHAMSKAHVRRTIFI